MKFTLEIQLGNDAMRTQADVRDCIARSFSMEEDRITLQAGDSLPLRDTNGNRVGSWQITADTAPTIGRKLRQDYDKSPVHYAGQVISLDIPSEEEPIQPSPQLAYELAKEAGIREAYEQSQKTVSPAGKEEEHPEWTACNCLTWREHAPHLHQYDILKWVNVGTSILAKHSRSPQWTAPLGDPSGY